MTVRVGEGESKVSVKFFTPRQWIGYALSLIAANQFFFWYSTWWAATGLTLSVALIGLIATWVGAALYLALAVTEYHMKKYYPEQSAQLDPSWHERKMKKANKSLGK